MIRASERVNSMPPWVAARIAALFSSSQTLYRPRAAAIDVVIANASQDAIVRGTQEGSEKCGPQTRVYSSNKVAPIRSEVAVEPMAYPKKYDSAGNSIRVALR